jgi:N4-gp56 family major capsid protein
MVDAFTGTAQYANLVQAAVDRMVEFALRAQPTFRAVADKRPVQQNMPGSSVVFNLYQDLAKVTTALTETVDPDAVALSNTNQVTVTLNEYGNAVLATRKLDLFSLTDIDPAIANIVAWNMVDSLDDVVQTELRQGTNVARPDSAGTVAWNSGAVTDIDGDDIITAAAVRLVVAKLRANKAVPRRGSLYAAYIHPEVSHDLRAETGAAAWRDPHVYSAPDAIWAGEIGAFEGAFFIETPRAYQATDGGDADGGGAGTALARVFRTVFCGQQALAEAVSEEPHTVIGPVTDKLMRHRPIGWYGVLGWKRYREESLARIESTSSINST